MKGILFKPDMIKAIVEGRKTQTRRLLNPPPFIEHGVLRWQPKRTGGLQGMHKPDINMDDHADLAKMFANYQVGDVVYIKEAWTYVTLAEKDPWKDKAEKDGSFRRMPDGSPVSVWYKSDGAEIGASWSTPLFMPAWAARYFIQITDVKVQRLQEISPRDCVAEGMDNADPNFTIMNNYIKLWDSINPKYPWASNPWVWVYSLSRAKGLPAKTLVQAGGDGGSKDWN